MLQVYLYLLNKMPIYWIPSINEIECRSYEELVRSHIPPVVCLLGFAHTHTRDLSMASCCRTSTTHRPFVVGRSMGASMTTIVLLLLVVAGVDARPRAAPCKNVINCEPCPSGLLRSDSITWLGNPLTNDTAMVEFQNSMTRAEEIMMQYPGVVSLDPRLKLHLTLNCTVSPTSSITSFITISILSRREAELTDDRCNVSRTIGVSRSMLLHDGAAA